MSIHKNLKKLLEIRQHNPSKQYCAYYFDTFGVTN